MRHRSIALTVQLLVGATASGIVAPASALAQSASSRLNVRLLKRLSVAQRATAPTFAPVDAPALMDRGRMLYIGGGMWHEQQRLYLVQLADKKTIEVEAPLSAFLHSSGMLRPGQRPLHRHFHLEALLFHDRENREAGLELVDAQADERGVRRHFFLRWDLARRRIDEATLVARTRAQASFASLTRVGYDHHRRAFYYVRDVRKQDAPSAPRTISVVAFVAGKPRVVTQFRTRRPLHRMAYLDPDHQRALLVEYAEVGGRGGPPSGHLVDLEQGTVQRLTVPLTAYGASFDAGGRWLHVYSSQTGMLWAVDLRPPGGGPPRTAERISVGTLGHALGRLGDGRLLLVRNAGLQLIDLHRRRRGAFVPIGQIYSGFSHVQGSVVAPSEVVIKNGQLLHFVGL